MQMTYNVRTWNQPGTRGNTKYCTYNSYTKSNEGRKRTYRMCAYKFLIIHYILILF